MKKIFLCTLLFLVLGILLSGCRPDPQSDSQDEEIYDAKPVIYLYPEVQTDVEVTLEYQGTLTASYPRYDGAWRVSAAPDGTLTDENGQSYNYLYWEGKSDTQYDFSRGFVVAGSETVDFLETTLEAIGLTRREANEFIVYWLPRMEANAYNLISFQTDAYTAAAQLSISPQPDSILRVFMAWKPLDAPIDIVPQEFSTFQRIGFTVVEWGGAEASVD